MRSAELVLGVTALLIAGGALAQSKYPERPVHLVVGFPGGSPADVVGRLFGQRLADLLGRPVVVDNVVGAGGNIASDRVAKAAPDGHTLGLLSQGQIAINPHLYRLPFDPLGDLAPVSQVTVSPNILVVNNAVPARSLADLVNLARSNPGDLTFASGGNGTTSHMAAELMRSVAGLELRHIPYKGISAAIPDLVAGRVTMMLTSIEGVVPAVRDGRLRALAVASPARLAALPDLPTIAESGYPGFEVSSWFGVFAPARTPEVIIGRLHLELGNALAHSELRAKLADLGLQGIGSPPEAFAAGIRAEIPRWAKVIRDAGIRLD